MGRVGIAGPHSVPQDRPCLFACIYLLTVIELTVATVVSLLPQPVDIYYHWDVFCPKAPTPPRYFYVDLRITQKAFSEDLVEITICTSAVKGRNKVSKQANTNPLGVLSW